MADRGVNQVILLGRLVVDAEEKESRTGTPYCWLKLAVNTERPRRNGELQEQKTEFIRCVLYNAHGVLPYLKKGRQVSIQGRLESYQKDKDSPLLMNVNLDRLILTDQKPVDAITEGEQIGLETYIEELQQRNSALMEQEDNLKAELAAMRQGPAT